MNINDRKFKNNTLYLIDGDILATYERKASRHIFGHYMKTTTDKVVHVGYFTSIKLATDADIKRVLNEQVLDTLIKLRYDDYMFDIKDL